MSNLTPEHKAIFEGKKLALAAHLKMSNGSSYIYKCKELGLTKIVVNERIRGKYSSKVLYTIADDDRGFTDLASVGDELLRRRRVTVEKEQENASR